MKIRLLLKNLICKIFGHDWEEWKECEHTQLGFEDGTWKKAEERSCKRCWLAMQIR